MMDSLNISIRGNITADLIERHNEKVKEEEEKQRIAAASAYAANNEASRVWMDSHVNLWRYTSATFFSQNPAKNGFGASAPCDISFYEWGDVGRIPRRFDCYLDLYKFLDECGIVVDYPLNTEMRRHDNGCFYLTCRKNSKELIGTDSYLELKRLKESGV